MLGTIVDISHRLPGGAALNSVAGGFALWASVSEARSARAKSSCDLLLFAVAAALGAASFIVATPILQHVGRARPELTLATGASLVGYLRHFGLTGAGFGSRVYIGQLLAYGAPLGSDDLPAVGLAGLVAALASIVPRLLSGPAERRVQTRRESHGIRMRGQTRQVLRQPGDRSASPSLSRSNVRDRGAGASDGLR